MGRFSMETVYNVWDDDHGEKISVGPDSDALGLVEIIDHETKSRLTMPADKARLLASALLKAAADAESEASK
jgi:hypothetical protein